MRMGSILHGCPSNDDVVQVLHRKGMERGFYLSVWATVAR